MWPSSRNLKSAFEESSACGLTTGFVRSSTPDDLEATVAHDKIPEQSTEAERGRWTKLPERVLPEDMTSAQAEPRVPLPEDPHKDALYSGG